MLAMPGDYTRGMLAGRAGDRVDPRALLAHWGLADLEDDSNLGMARDFGVAMLTDPLSYLGSLGGSRAGQALFNKLGPRLGANPAKVANLAIPAKDMESGGVAAFQQAMQSPAAGKILHEIPEGSRYLGAGAESMNLATPQGDVLKILKHNPKAAIDVPAVEGVLQPTRRVTHGGFEVNRVPMAQGVGDEALHAAHAEPLRQRLASQGVDVFDLKPEDLGLVGGKPTIIDMGSVDALNPAPFRPRFGQATNKYLVPGALAGAAASTSPSVLYRTLMGGS